METYRRATKLELAEPNEYLMVNRLYPAAEGEGTTIGQAKWFLRFQGCSVGCKWCDSKETWRFDELLEAWSPENNHMMFKLEEADIDAFLADLRSRYPLLHHVSITGGEPLQQNPRITRILVRKMIEKSYIIQVETSGQIPLDNTDYREAIIDILSNRGLVSIDFKTPSSGLDANMRAIKHCLEIRKGAGVQVKAVVADEEDYIAARTAFNELMPEYPRAEYIITPCWEPGKTHALAKEAEEFFDRLFKDDQWHCLPKVILQQHKVIFGTDNLDS